jgi:glycerate dehydrogenase
MYNNIILITEDKHLKITVLDSATLGEDLDLSPLSAIMETEIYKNTPPEAVAERIAESDVVIINKVKLNESNLAKAKNLKLICIAATGFDNIDVTYCKKAGIAVCNVIGYSSLSVAQITVATVLSLACHLHEHTETVRSGRYTESGVANSLTPVYHELAGKTWGIVGYGNIGKQVGRVAEALGCRVIYNKRTSDGNANCVSLETVCAESDIITVHTPLSDSTRGLIDDKAIRLMKRDVIFVNEARGAVTDEKALADAVKEGRIGALGCDVYSVEPFGKDHPFYEIKDLPNVCLTPHMAWGAYEARVRCLGEIILNIKAFFNGEIRSRVDI